MLSVIDETLLTVHARMALGLLAAEHIAPLLAWRPVTRTLVENTLRADWSWMETRIPDPAKLYWDYIPRLMEEDTELREDTRVLILHCALYAHTYAIWSAEGVTNLEKPGTVLGIGNDIADVDESYLTHCLELAIQLSPQSDQTEEWLNGLIALLERTQRKTETEVIGPRLKRSSFTVPIIAPV